MIIIKKIILLLIIIMCSSCQDYHELNDIALVSGISIDYKNNMYELTYEIVNTNNEDNHSYTINSTSKALDEAFTLINEKTNKDIILSHLDIVIISNNIDIYDIKDFFMNNDDITTNFYLLYSNNPKDILEYNNDNYYNNSIYIKKLLIRDNIDIHMQFDYLVTNNNNNNIYTVNIIDNNLLIERNNL